MSDNRRTPVTAIGEETSEDQELAEIARSESRKLKVLRLKMRGCTLQEIAGELGISVSTVSRELEAIRELNKNRIEAFDMQAEVADTMASYDDLIEQAWVEYNVPTSTPSHRLKCLDYIRQAKNDKMRIMQEIGLVETKPEQVDHSIKVDVINEWSESAQKQIAEAILQSMLTPITPMKQLEEAEIIDIKPEEALPSVLDDEK